MLQRVKETAFVVLLMCSSQLEEKNSGLGRLKLSTARTKTVGTLLQQTGEEKLTVVVCL
jgi:hypothetical protein